MAIKIKKQCGFSLVEVMLAIVILAIIVLGAVGYRYWAAMDARKAMVYSTANRIGLLMLEAWRGNTDPNTFNPTSLSTSFVPVVTTAGGPSDTSGTMTQFGNALKVTVKKASATAGTDLDFFVTLWKQSAEESYIDTFYNRKIILRKYQAVVAFPEGGNSPISYSDTFKRIALSSYKKD